MRLKDYREAHRARVVECAIFATRNSLKSKAAQNMKSPFSNIRAIISKLHWRSAPSVRHNARSPIAGSFLGGFRTPATVHAAMALQVECADCRT
jgi:hypothetical protein